MAKRKREAIIPEHRAALPRVGDVWRFKTGQMVTVIARPSPLTVVIQYEDGTQKGIYHRSFWKQAVNRPGVVPKWYEEQ